MDERKLKILSAVVDQYIVTGEPVGSKAIMNILDINVSAATIRNDMAALEQMGFLEQPHTSAGRIPTFNGYRLYVDKLMLTNPLSEDEMQKLDDMLVSKDYSEESIVEQASNALAEITKCATIVTNSSPKFSVISKVEVIPTGKRLYILLMITSNGSIKNKVCRLEFDLTEEQINYFSNFMTQNLEGIALDEISDELMQKLATAMGAYMMTLTPLISGICEMSHKLLENEVVVTGEKNLLTCKDFDQNQIINFLENRQEFAKLLDDSFSGLQVLFSNENDTFVINNSSIITSSFSKDGKNIGKLGVIGPMRINYSKIIPYVEYLTNKITELMTDKEDDDNNDQT